VRTIPSVRRGTPEQYEAGEYRQIDVDGATVYVHSSLQELAQVQIDAESSIFGSKLVLRGIEEDNTGCCG
jgi:hypothetical protein